MGVKEWDRIQLYLFHIFPKDSMYIIDCMRKEVDM